MKQAARTLVFLACVLFSVSAAYNVLSDNAEVQGMASSVACRDQGANCRAQMTRMERTPIAQTFELATQKRKVEIRCAREFLLVGEYICALR